LVAAAKFLAAATKKFFVVFNFVALTKPFFFPCRVFSDQGKSGNQGIILSGKYQGKIRE